MKFSNILFQKTLEKLFWKTIVKNVLRHLFLKNKFSSVILYLTNTKKKKKKNTILKNFNEFLHNPSSIHQLEALYSHNLTLEQ